MLLALPCPVGSALTAEYIVPLLFGKAFLPSVSTLRILSILILIFSIAYFLGHIVLTAAGLERKILYATVAGAFINTIANFLLIPSLKQNGAAIASVLSEVTVTVILLWNARGCYNISIGKRYVVSTVLATIGMAIVVINLDIVWKNQVWYIFLTIILAVITYFIILIMGRNEVVQLAIIKICDKIKKLYKE